MIFKGLNHILFFGVPQSYSNCMYEIVNPKHVFGIKMTVLSIVINKVRVYVRFLYFKSALAVFTMNGK